MRHYNEKPAQNSNLGEDIPDAARHHRDTYETPEELRQKAFKKQSTKDLKALLAAYKDKFKLALGESTESAVKVLQEYEFKKTLLSSELFNSFTGESMDDLKAFVLNTTDRQTREIIRKKYNSLYRKRHKLRYIRPIELQNYFEPKKRESFREDNGVEREWSTESKGYDKSFLEQKIRALQFGNSLTEVERIYCAENLIKSINEIEQHFKVNFKSLGFSFGARGKAGSVAHYEDSLKVLAFNRNRDGALIHELGHAIDYALGKVSSSMPYGIRRKYEQKLRDSKNEFILAFLPYYMKPTEIFARMFEKYCMDLGFNDFALTKGDFIVLPDLKDEEIRAWFLDAIKTIKKAA